MACERKKFNRFLYLHGIHKGGGLTLVKEVLRVARRDDSCCFVFDDRIKAAVDFEGYKNAVFFPGGLLGRLQSELYVWRQGKKSMTVLSMNSIPFILPIKCRQIVFFQNVNLLINKSSEGSINFFRNFLFLTCSKRVDKFVAQTETVRALLSQKTKKPVEIFPILDKKMSRFSTKHKPLKRRKKGRIMFAYVADSSPHKNHWKLIQAWQLLHEEITSFNCQLILTIPDGAGTLWHAMGKSIDLEAFSIFNFGTLSRDKVFSLYRKADALIYPSLRESFGIPLIEASSLGCDIIAAELDYVRDVCEPVETFNPGSSVSIARSIARYLGHSHLWPLQPVSTDHFIKRCFSE